MKTIRIPFFASALISCALPLAADTAGRSVTLELVADNGQRICYFPAPGFHADSRVYAEAVQGESYRIRVRNNLDRRVGVVIAVDGRNIISGAKSWLRNNERMYILGPHETAEYDGWRTGQDKVNRFYFTQAPDSYASAFHDESAMGVIALAAYPEFTPRPAPRPIISSNAASGAAAQPAPSVDSMAPRSEAKAAAGTGYGEEEYSPSYTVAFQPEAVASEKTFIKYEWHDTLCQLGVIRDQPPQPRRNRLWDDGFAPPPLGRR